MDRQHFTNAMRKVANSVSVVTTNGFAGRHGATVSAFCSVSADPPTVLVCLNSHSKIADLVLANGAFAINVLPEHHEGIAQRFAGANDAQISCRFDGLDMIDADLPTFSSATVFHCDLETSMLSGSHHIIIGKVTSVICGGSKPLTYLDGAYHRIYAANQQSNEVCA